MDIHLVRREDIDKQLYNSCVHYATNGSIYGYDWYLQRYGEGLGYSGRGHRQLGFSYAPTPPKELVRSA